MALNFTSYLKKPNRCGGYCFQDIRYQETKDGNCEIWEANEVSPTMALREFPCHGAESVM